MSRTMMRTFALMVAVGTATLATADTYFENGQTLERSGNLELGLITADGDGVVEIYDYSTGVVGELLGTEDIHAGANTDVRVSTGLPAAGDVLAVVKIGGQVVAEKAFDVESN